MKKFTLARSYLSDRTIGVFRHEAFQLASLERAWNDNWVNDSCIPEGAYLVDRDKHGRHQFYAVQDVGGRTAIELHGGVYPYNSNGCILLGLTHTLAYNLDMPDAAMNDLLNYVGDDSFILTIRAANKDDFQ